MDATALYQQHHSTILTYLERRCHDHELAEDLAHDVWVRALESLDRYDERHKIDRWLFTIAARLLIDWQRRRAIRPIALLSDLSGYAGAAEDPDLRSVPDRLLIAQGLPHLTPPQQQAVRDLLADRPHTQTARGAGGGVNDSKKLRSRALAALRRAMEAQVA